MIGWVRFYAWGFVLGAGVVACCCAYLWLVLQLREVVRLLPAGG